MRGFPGGPAPARIVSLVPSWTEALFALGLGPRVVGVTDWCICPTGHGKPAVRALWGSLQSRAQDPRSLMAKAFKGPKFRIRSMERIKGEAQCLLPPCALATRWSGT